MSIARDLDQRYNEVCERSDARHVALTHIAGALASGFIEYLGLEDNTWSKSDGLPGGERVRLGTGSPEKFEEKHWAQLRTITDGSIYFSIAYTLVSHPRSQILVNTMKLAIVDDHYELTIDHVADKLPLTAADIRNKSFDPIYALIVERIREIVNPNDVYVPSE